MLQLLSPYRSYFLPCVIRQHVACRKGCESSPPHLYPHAPCRSPELNQLRSTLSEEEVERQTAELIKKVREMVYQRNSGVIVHFGSIT